MGAGEGGEVEEVLGGVCQEVVVGEGGLGAEGDGGDGR